MIRVKGDVNFISVLNKSILILNSFSAARDLLEKRSAIYSSRPTLVMLGEMWVATRFYALDICLTGAG